MSMSEMIPLELDRYSVLGDDWIVDGHSFTAQLIDGRREQILVFADRLRNGSISADITLLDSNAPSQEPPNEAALVVRYGGPDSYAYGGIGGFGAKFFIGKASQGPSLSSGLMRASTNRYPRIRNIDCASSFRAAR
jgi:hypothetical protein